jgi:hypothetical protein
MKTWSADLRELAYESTTGTGRAEFTRELVEAATSRHVEAPWCSAVRCIARLGRRTCRARIQVGQPEASRVEWSCPTCGERGEFTGFEGTELDLSSHVPRGKKLRVWGFDDESREVLLAGTTQIPSLRAVVARASPAAEIAGLLVLQATVDELDEIYTLVVHLTDATRSRRRIELLDDLRIGFCSAMDDF